MVRRLRLVASLPVVAAGLASLPSAAPAQIASLVTHKDVPACQSLDDGRLFAQAVDLRQVETFRNLLESGRCVIWPKGTTIHLDQSVEGCGMTRVRGICGAVYGRISRQNPQVFVAPLDEAWTRRQLPVSSPDSLAVMLAKAQDPNERDDAVPLPRPRPAARPKAQGFATALTEKLTKLFRPSPTSTTTRDHVSY
jgi:hypothetical protein